MPYSYSGFGLTILSDLELPELPPGHGQPDLVVRIGVTSDHSGIISGTHEVAGSRHAGLFEISGGREIVVEPRPGVDASALRVLLLGRIMAFAMRQRGWLPLHGSAVVINGRAVLFLGKSGAGKSTAAACLYLRGHEVAADDICPVKMSGDECILQRSSSKLRLDESISMLEGAAQRSEFQVDKRAWLLSNRGPDEAIPIGRIYLLSYGEELRLVPVAPSSSAAFLSKNSFMRHHRQGASIMRAHLQTCAEIARMTRVYGLERRRDLSSLSDFADLVEREAEIR